MDNPVTELLKKALANFGSSGEHWSQGAEACESPKCCVATAMIREFNRVSIGWKDADDAARILRKLTNGHMARWNDAPGRTFAEVKEVCLKAIAESEKIVSP